MKILSPVLCLLSTGCAELTNVFSKTLPTDGVGSVFCDSDRGDFTYAGGSEEVFDIQVRAWGAGQSRRQAEGRRDRNTWGAVITDDGLLDLWGRSEDLRAGTDIAVAGPSVIDVESVLLDGTARLYDVDGFHYITANRIEGSGIQGDVDLYAALDGIDVEVYPHPGSTIRLEAYGDVVLKLPLGLEYDLEAFPDPGWGAEILDLGFDELWMAPDYISAVTGSGAIRVEIYVVGGTFFLWSAP
ncbi:MAG TPA: hypothetical protein ENK18_23375 [Deltaproteobacteria bacterium]|nr:hypothetical protein [Deltaproteobacteria bacterium]